ncbi:RNA-dependent RNA polymerase [Erysiphe necator associated narnavirus 37]|nr:RNA-dependent RNA polymerase [Erysiphe necator associated narnavirus 37]
MERHTYKRLTSFVKSPRGEATPSSRKNKKGLHRMGRKSLEQQVWTACYSALVFSGWDDRLVAWHLHAWVSKTVFSRGYEFCCSELKKLCHEIRSVSLQAKDLEITSRVPSGIRECLLSLCKKERKNGFAFTRLGRGLPLPPKKGMKKALQDAEQVSATCHLTPDWVLERIGDFVRSRTFRKIPVSPRTLPSSTSSCSERSGATGGVDAYLRQLGLETLMDLSFGRLDGRTSYQLAVERFGQFSQDSLGTFCLKRVRESVDQFDSNLHDEHLRCLGLLKLRSMRPQAKCKAVCLRSPGMKYRVIGVPDALTFIEGTWIRWSSNLLPREHFDPSGSKFPKNLDVSHDGGKFYSVDLTKATDGLSHQVVEAVIRALPLRSSDVNLALRSLGCGGFGTLWDFSGRTMISKRGSPMGTPLSFVVLSWVNAFATSAFTASVTHGDDAVGYSENSFEFEEYRDCIEAMGASVNLSKTYVSEHSFTLCERMYVPRRKQRKSLAFCPPSCPVPGGRVPTSAQAELEPHFLNRSERVQKTLFPWITRNPAVRLPTSVGGLGYTGRGLRVSLSVRTRLAAACSRDVKLLAEEALERSTFRGEGLFPRSLVPSPRRSAAYFRMRSLLIKGDRRLRMGDEIDQERVLLSDFIVYRERSIVRSYLTMGGKMGQAKSVGKPEKMRARALFSKSAPKNVKPLSVAHGLKALEKLSVRILSQEVRVRKDVASEIRGSTTEMG